MINKKVSNLPLAALLVTLGGLLSGGCNGPETVAVQESTPGPDSAVRSGWLSWRGPDQNGTSREKGLPASVDPAGPAWSFPVSGRGTPVIGDGRLYAMAYSGEGPTLRERIICLDARTGRPIWQHHFTDFLTDSIYSRFAIGSPTIDRETGNVYCLTTAGLFCCFTRNGRLLWQHSMMSEYGRLTFPNGRTGAPLVDSGLAIVHVATSGWGAQGPARDRFYAFDKDTGVSVWSCTPGGPPKDTSFSFPVVATDAEGRRVLYAGLAGGHVVCVDVRSGQPLWRFPLATGGLSSSPVLFGDTVIAMHGKENLDDTTAGRMVAIRRGARPGADGKQRVLGRESEVWRAHLTAFTSSPILVGDRVFSTVHTGELVCTDARTGAEHWHQKLAPDQIHASPAYGDGRLYVPMNNGSFYIIKPLDKGPEIIQRAQLEGNCLGAPAIADGMVFVHTTKKLYAFAGPGRGPAPLAARPAPPRPGKPVRLQVLPADFLALQGTSIPVRVRSLDARGLVVSDSVGPVTWSGVPKRGVGIGTDGTLDIAADAAPAGSVLKAEAFGLRGSARLRIVPRPPYSIDFEGTPLRPHAREEGVKFAFPPASWIGAKLKWEVREHDGNLVLAKTLDRPLFQRSMSLFGHPDMRDYTVQADVMTDGNRRIKSSVGLVNQRYLIVLRGNYQDIEVSSNVELLKKTVPFRWKVRTWYRIKTRVDAGPEGSSIVRARVWKRGDPEPEGWTIEVTHPHGHTHGSPGVFGFSPQSRFRVYVDNISVTAND